MPATKDFYIVKTKELIQNCTKHIENLEKEINRLHIMFLVLGFATIILAFFTAIFASITSLGNIPAAITGGLTAVVAAATTWLNPEKNSGTCKSSLASFRRLRMDMEEFLNELETGNLSDPEMKSMFETLHAKMEELETNLPMTVGVISGTFKIQEKKLIDLRRAIPRHP